VSKPRAKAKRTYRRCASSHGSRSRLFPRHRRYRRGEIVGCGLDSAATPNLQADDQRAKWAKLAREDPVSVRVRVRDLQSAGFAPDCVRSEPSTHKGEGTEREAEIVGGIAIVCSEIEQGATLCEALKTAKVFARADCRDRRSQGNPVQFAKFVGSRSANEV